MGRGWVVAVAVAVVVSVYVRAGVRGMGGGEVPLCQPACDGTGSGLSVPSLTMTDI